MALLRTFENDEYLPEFGTVVLRDTFDPDARAALPPVGEMLGELATDALPGGSIARAGAGWLQASAGDGYHVVRLEAHDRAPADDRGAWEDVVETPYRSSIGSVGLAHMTSGPWNADLDLGGPGVYRVRVARRPAAEDGDVWRLQFWPTPAAVEPPRWLARHRPATRGGRSGWDEVLGYEATELAFMVRATAAGQPDGVTVARLQAWGTQHSRSPGWLDEPLWRAPPTPLPTGHADLDAHAEDRRRSLLADAARRAGALAEVAAQLRVPPPATRRGLLELLVAAGLLTADDSGGPRRYGFVAQPRRAQEVLRLAPERVAMLERQDAMQRYVWLAADVAAVVMWVQHVPAVVTVQGLADRLLASPYQVRATLGYAVDARLLDAGGDLADPTSELRLRLLPRRDVTASHQPAPQPAPAAGPPWNRPAATTEAIVAFTGAGVSRPARAGAAAHDRPPLGEPPRAGFVSATGDVVVWRGGEPVVLARLPEGSTYRALESAYGIVLLRFGDQAPPVVVRPDGHVDALGAELAPRVALSEDGRYLAVDESHHGRRSWSLLHLVDLADGSRQTMPWDEDAFFSITAVYGGVVYFQGGRAQSVSMRWSPGSDPEPSQHRLDEIDPLSGARLAHDDQPGVLVVRPDGTARRVLVAAGVALAPGGERLYAYRYSPPAVTLFHVATGAEHPRIFWLPPGSQMSTTVPGRPVWEDADHLVVSLGHQRLDVGAPAVRLDVRTGAFEGVPLTEDAGYRPLLTEPLLRHA